MGTKARGTRASGIKLMVLHQIRAIATRNRASTLKRDFESHTTAFSHGGSKRRLRQTRRGVGARSCRFWAGLCDHTSQDSKPGSGGTPSSLATSLVVRRHDSNCCRPRYFHFATFVSRDGARRTFVCFVFCAFSCTAALIWYPFGFQMIQDVTHTFR